MAEPVDSLSTKSPAAVGSKLDQGDLILKARISPKSFIGSYVIWSAFLLLVLIAGFMLKNSDGKLLVPGWITFLVAIIPLAVSVAHSQLVKLTTEYRIFEESIEVEQGFIARKIENIQLFRVRDIGFGQGVLGRIFNFGSVTLASTDHSSPHLTLTGVNDPVKVYDTLRAQTAKSQAARRTMIVEGEGVEEMAGHNEIA
jgi:uncharacterized membrane protein YdbT with pleckstrin-like domain